MPDLRKKCLMRVKEGKPGHDILISYVQIFALLKEYVTFPFAEASLPKIATSDGTVSWYNREPRVLPVGGTIEVLSGTKVTLTCKYSAFPQAAVQWTVLGEEGQDLEQDAGYEVINGSLVLMALQPSDSARYVCSVRNVAGTSSATTTLKVLGECFNCFVFK